MRNEVECLAKAAEMDRRADSSRTSQTQDAYREMANGWRKVANHAAWQDEPALEPAL